jgi:hypothetical protein
VRVFSFLETAMTDASKPSHTEEMVLLRKEDFNELLACAAERALAHIGLASDHAARDIHELRDLLEARRDARRTALQTVIKVMNTGIMLLLVVRAPSKLDLWKGL